MLKVIQQSSDLMGKGDSVNSGMENKLSEMKHHLELKNH